MERLTKRSFPSFYLSDKRHQSLIVQYAELVHADNFFRPCGIIRAENQDTLSAQEERIKIGYAYPLTRNHTYGLGGLQTAIRSLAKKMKYDNYQVVTYPNVEKNFWDMLAEMPAARNTSHARVGSEQIIR